MADQSLLRGLLARRSFLQALSISGFSAAIALGTPPESREELREPIFRVSKANNPPVDAAAKVAAHPLDPAIDLANETLIKVQREITDYTAMIVKRERVNGKLGNHEFMEAKIRNRKIIDGKLAQPLSVYLKFVKPDSMAGREVIWVEGANNGKMRAHEGGATGKFLPTVWLDPNGILAMRGQLHPITEIGFENLVAKLIEKGEKDRKHSECEVEFKPGAKINGRACTVLQVKHPTPRPHFEFHIAQIFIDDETKLPVRYAAFHWPTDPADKLGPVIEEYTYLDVKLNPGLVDADFDPNNPNYNF
ncbi:hypothetical protein ETAA8_47520 [Anatilimnocola aggregata]|uniref:DUF1571 domain-containing protein n=1 Tax=Anatilimnocola aggregata TaxID=2528021 RepID=A0A517YHB9_9BACT|nr:DUF1571 domain-containing protein [Anatilimnocola aggregata]QDU29637.1 hypothetical protein ETAA8_47520 [Anatilimnocola aggregata]